MSATTLLVRSFARSAAAAPLARSGGSRCAAGDVLLRHRACRRHHQSVASSFYPPSLRESLDASSSYVSSSTRRSHPRRSFVLRRLEESEQRRWFASSSSPDEAGAEGGSEGEGEEKKCIMDVCNLNIVSSPYPPIESPPYPPLSEFVSSDWSSDSDSKHSSKVAMYDFTTGQSRTFGQYRSLTSAIAGALSSQLGINEESTVCLFSPNHVDYVPLTLAVSRTGGRMTPVNPLYTKGELADILERSRTELLIVHENLLEVGMEAVRMCNEKVKRGGVHEGVKHVVAIPASDDENEDDDGEIADVDGSSYLGTLDADPALPDGVLSLSDLKSYGSTHPLHSTVPSVKRNEDTGHRHPFLLPYSSGTTGLPKAVCLSHLNLVSNLLQMDEVEGMSFPSDHKLISPLPFFHIYGFLASALYSAWRGQTVVTFSGRFDFVRFCEAVQEHKPQRAHLVPPILIGLAKHPAADEYDMSSLGTIVSAAAPLGADVERAVTERLEGVAVKQAWGMSELSPIGTFVSDFNIKSGSIGPLVSSTYGKVVDTATGRSLGPNETGELLIKGPQVMMGYLDAPDKTAECLSADGWLRTGDVAKYDEDGFFFITDRLKELIKVRGYQVAPAELEALLLTHPAVRDCAVIPRVDEVSGELPRAYVALKEEEEGGDATATVTAVTEEEIQEWVKERVAPHKRLNGGVVFTEEIPKSASGKILRRILVELDRSGE